MRNSKSYRWNQRWSATEQARKRRAQETNTQGFFALILAMILAFAQRS